MRIKILVMIAVSLVAAFGFFSTQNRVSDSNAQTNPTQSATVAVCIQQDICVQDPTIPRFTSIEAAKRALEPVGGGTILLMPGIYRTTLSFQGNWTLRGTKFAENTILLPKEKGSSRFDGADVGLFTIEPGSTLRLENVTLQDDFVPITLDESNLYPDDGIANEVYGELYGRVATGVIVKENARLVADNVRFLNWLFFTLEVVEQGEAEVQDSDFSCPSNVLHEPTLFIQGKASFSRSFFDHCTITGTIPTDFEFSDSEFRNSTIRGGTSLSITGSRFRDPWIFGPHADLLKVLPLIFTGLKTTLTDNTFEISDRLLKYIDASGVEALNLHNFRALVVGGDLTAINNVFRRFSVALDLASSGNIQLAQNTFEQNQIALEFRELSQYNLENNRLIENEECAIFVRSSLTETLQLQGKDNEFQGNAQDVCPAGFPLPEGFVKQTM